jgi:hypothetical protein
MPSDRIFYAHVNIRMPAERFRVTGVGNVPEGGIRPDSLAKDLIESSDGA